MMKINLPIFSNNGPFTYSQNFYENFMGRNTDVINNIEDASYAKLREISISYNFGKINNNLFTQKHWLSRELQHSPTK